VREAGQRQGRQNERQGRRTTLCPGGARLQSWAVSEAPETTTKQSEGDDPAAAPIGSPPPPPGPRARPRPVGSLRTRLLLGIGVAVAGPLLLFAWFGSAELRRSTRDNLIVHLVQGLARSGAERVDAWFTRTERAARLVCAAEELQAAFAGLAGRERFERWFVQAGPEVRSLGDLLLADRGPDADWRIVVRTREEQPGMLQGDLTAALRAMLEEVESRDQARFFPPLADPFSQSTTLSRPSDPTGYVLPYAVPLRRPNQLPLGVVLFLLPFEDVQRIVADAEQVLAEDWRIEGGDAFVIDRAQDLYLLHGDRARIGQSVGVLRAAEEAAGELDVAAFEDIRAELELKWAFGVRASERELFRSVDRLGSFFVVLIVALLAATLGIAAMLLVAATRPLRELVGFAREIGAGHLEARAAQTGPREVRTLGHALNTMAEQLAEDRERRRVAEREAAWTKMARQVAHEIKNPLQPVRLHGELLRRELGRAELDEELRERMLRSNEVVLRQVDALQRIVADFSKFASAGLPEHEQVPFAAGDVLRELEELYAEKGEEGVSVRFDIDPKARSCQLRGSPLRLQQVFVNLIKNAIEASIQARDAEENPLDAGAEREVLVRARVATAPDGKSTWHAEVLDQGTGLPGDGEQLFEPYFSTKKGGTGLGLAISRRSIEAMGGTLTLEAQQPRGCQARLQLPTR
jgi:signal transduction histidine kinase